MRERTPDAPEPETVDERADVIGHYDSEDGVPTYVVADVRSDEGWVAARSEATLSLEEWR